MTGNKSPIVSNGTSKSWDNLLVDRRNVQWFFQFFWCYNVEDATQGAIEAWPVRPQFGQQILPFVHPKFHHLPQWQGQIHRGHMITAPYDWILLSDWLCISILLHCHHWGGTLMQQVATRCNCFPPWLNMFRQHATWWILIEWQLYEFPHCFNYLWCNSELQVITAVWNHLYTQDSAVCCEGSLCVPVLCCCRSKKINPSLCHHYNVPVGRLCRLWKLEA